MKDIIKTCGCGLTFREPKEGQGHCPACVTRARSQQSDEVVRAAGTSEGVRKAWESRRNEMKDAASHHRNLESDHEESNPQKSAAHGRIADLFERAHEHMSSGSEERAEELFDRAQGLEERHIEPHHYFTTKASDTSTSSIHASGNSEGAKKGWEKKHTGGLGSENGVLLANLTGGTHKGTGIVDVPGKHGGKSLFHNIVHPNPGKAVMEAHEHLTSEGAGGVVSVSNPSPKGRHGWGISANDGDGNVHHITFMRSRVDRERLDGSDETETDVIHCRSHSALGPVLAASKPWNAGERVEFMWMPAGVSTICAGFRKGSIELTVQCSEETAQAVQASLNEWRNERPKQEPFGCIEHKEQEASFRISASCGFKWGNDGVYLAAEPTTLGAQNVNGKVHRSWSPSFTTDADYASATERDGVLMFPEGARGSRSNPAKITGVDFCVGTLTNKPAFHSMSPVRAKDSKDADYNRTNGGNQATNEELAISFRNDVPDYTQAELLVYCNRIRKGGSHMEAVTEARATRNSGSAKANEKPTLESIFAKTLKATETANTIAESHGAVKLTAEDVYERYSVKANAPVGNQNAAGPHEHQKILDELDAFGRMSRQGLEDHVKLSNRVSDLKSADKWTLVSMAIRDKHGDRRVDNAINWRDSQKKAKKAAAFDATPDSILERIYARAGASR